MLDAAVGIELSISLHPTVLISVKSKPVMMRFISSLINPLTVTFSGVSLVDFCVLEQAYLAGDCRSYTSAVSLSELTR